MFLVYGIIIGMESAIDNANLCEKRCTIGPLLAMAEASLSA